MSTLTDPTLFAAALITGFTLGIRHALDPDHIAAVSTLTTRNREYASVLRLAIWWGAGHTVTLAVSAVFLVLMKAAVPPPTELILESLVGVMLIVLGVRLLLGLSSSDDREKPIRTHSQSFVIGAVHGLAGSAAILLLAAAAIDTPLGVLLFVLVFGAGSILGMMLFTGLLGIPIHVYGENETFNRFFGRFAGVASVAVGFFVLVSSLEALIRG